MQIYLLKNRRLTFSKVQSAENVELQGHSWSADITGLDVLPVEDTEINENSAERLSKYLNADSREAEPDIFGGLEPFMNSSDQLKLHACSAVDSSKPEDAQSYFLFGLQKLDEENPGNACDLWGWLTKLIPGFTASIEIQHFTAAAAEGNEPALGNANNNAGGISATFDKDHTDFRCSGANFSVSEGLRFWWCIDTEIKLDFVCSLVLSLPDDSDFVKQDKLLNTPSNVFEKLMEDQDYFDFFVVSGDGVSLPCHRSFLAVHSPVLKSMLQSKMKETNENCIHIPEMSGVSMRAFVKFLYSCDTEAPAENSSVALDLYQAGHKYDIPGLEWTMKKLLLNSDNTQISLEVAIKMFCFARRVPEGQPLMEKAVLVLKENRTQLSEESEYKRVFHEDPEAAMEMLNIALGV